VPKWLADRMTRLGAVIAQAIVHHYGRDELLRRLAHPFWFQSFGAVMGMDWHSSGITTSVIGALKRGLNPLAGELGIHVCGGRGRHSRATPAELLAVGERVGIDGAELGRTSRLVAKVDSAALQDGFDLYLHGFVVTDDGRWVVVQQGMNGDSRQARRYHWLSEAVASFVDEPHAAIEGPGRGTIVNLTDRRAEASRRGQLDLLGSLGPDGIARRLAALKAEPETSPLLPGLEPPEASPLLPGLEPPEASPLLPGLEPPEASPLLPGLEPPEASPLLPHLAMPARHHVRPSDVVARRLHAALAAAAESGPRDYADLLLTPGVGARTVEALALAAEVVHGAPCRFSDPARFSFAHGGKDRHPFPVPLRVYDETIRVLKSAVQGAKLGREEELAALKRLDAQARDLERRASGPTVADHIARERGRSHLYGGRSVFGDEPAPNESEADAYRRAKGRSESR
jgi:hypothetical protein